jgi:hypothetical protein
MELDLQSLHICAQLYSLAETPAAPTPRIWAHARALMLSQDRRHLFVTPSCSSHIVVTQVSGLFQNVLAPCIYKGNILSSLYRRGILQYNQLIIYLFP